MKLGPTELVLQKTIWLNHFKFNMHIPEIHCWFVFHIPLKECVEKLRIFLWPCKYSDIMRNLYITKNEYKWCSTVQNFHPQVLISPIQWCCQQIFWRNNMIGQLNIYELKWRIEDFFARKLLTSLMIPLLNLPLRSKPEKYSF